MGSTNVNRFTNVSIVEQSKIISRVSSVSKGFHVCWRSNRILWMSNVLKPFHAFLEKKIFEGILTVQKVCYSKTNKNDNLSYLDGKIVDCIEMNDKKMELSSIKPSIYSLQWVFINFTPPHIVSQMFWTISLV